MAEERHVSADTGFPSVGDGEASAPVFSSPPPLRESLC